MKKQRGRNHNFLVNVNEPSNEALIQGCKISINWWNDDVKTLNVKVDVKHRECKVHVQVCIPNKEALIQWC